MSRRMLALAAVALFAAAIPASAQATTFHGSCQFTDASYSFTDDSYAFGSGLGTSAGGCNGSLNGDDFGGLATYESSGSGAFSCFVGTFSGGGGLLTFYGPGGAVLDTLSLSNGPGLALGSTVSRNVNGAVGGNAVENGVLVAGGPCDSGRYVMRLQVVNGSLTD